MIQGALRCLFMPDDTPYRGLVARTRTAPCMGKENRGRNHERAVTAAPRLPAKKMHHENKVEVLHIRLTERDEDRLHTRKVNVRRYQTVMPIPQPCPKGEEVSLTHTK
jgi:hypothetical protein